jgi:hypothetical protein
MAPIRSFVLQARPRSGGYLKNGLSNKKPVAWLSVAHRLICPPDIYRNGSALGSINNGQWGSAAACYIQALMPLSAFIYSFLEVEKKHFICCACNPINHLQTDSMIVHACVYRGWLSLQIWDTSGGIDT